jgi:hypothetical protein
MNRDDEVREQLINVLLTLQPYARSTGKFHDLADLLAAIRLASQYLKRAELLIDRRGP